jgi:hypothetical protein
VVVDAGVAVVDAGTVVVAGVVAVVDAGGAVATWGIDAE